MMPVTQSSRNPQCCYTGYVQAVRDLVNLDVGVNLDAGVSLDICADPAELIVAFINTVDVEAGSDALDTVEGWQSWLAGQGLGGCFGQESPDTLTMARELRDDLRTLAGGDRCAKVRQVGIQVALTADGKVELSAQTAVGLIAAAAAKVAVERRLDRVKICPADTCRWAFYDTSRNRSRQWCSMEVCGNRAKARAHRQRSTQH